MGVDLKRLGNGACIDGPGQVGDLSALIYDWPGNAKGRTGKRVVALGQKFGNDLFQGGIVRTGVNRLNDGLVIKLLRPYLVVEGQNGFGPTNVTG